MLASLASIRFPCPHNSLFFIYPSLLFDYRSLVSKGSPGDFSGVVWGATTLFPVKSGELRVREELETVTLTSSGLAQ